MLLLAWNVRSMSRGADKPASRDDCHVADFKSFVDLYIGQGSHLRDGHPTVSTNGLALITNPAMDPV
ncbi:hypothetical protein T492DRAFT_895542 [Pavlovales sp. CCMP2436]|nr:hypothetical protein T492DRAFT_895542 [Pavlovales sp. CCMP2436]